MGDGGVRVNWQGIGRTAKGDFMRRFLLALLVSVVLAGCAVDEMVTREIAAATPTLTPAPSATSTPSPTTRPTPFSTSTVHATTVPAEGKLVALSNPSGASLAILELGINGQTPYSTTLTSGEYTLVISLIGYETWTETIEIIPDETTNIHPQLESHYSYIPLEPIGEQTLAFLNWTDDHTLVYAVYDGIAEEPRNWTWWHYDLLTQAKVQLSSPESRVSEETREMLNLCPFSQGGVANADNCGATSVLYESSVSDIMVFSPPIIFGQVGEELWLANTNGTNSMKIADFQPSYARWSNDGKWLIIGTHLPAMLGQQIHYLISTDGSFVQPLSQITNHDSVQINGIYPEFSPDGRKLAYIGTAVFGSLDENDYGIYFLDLESFETTLLTEKFGLFQWEPNGNGLYILDGLGVLALPSTTNGPSEIQSDTSLVYLDLSTETPIEYLIARGISYHNQNSYIYWAVSPGKRAIASTGFQAGNELGILLLESGE